MFPCFAFRPKVLRRVERLIRKCEIAQHSPFYGWIEASFADTLMSNVAENLLSDCIPGVLSDRQMKKLISQRLITGVDDPEEQVDYSSIDLTLANEGYRMREGSLKPFVSPEKGGYLTNVLGDSQFAERIAGKKGIYELWASPDCSDSW